MKQVEKEAPLPAQDRRLRYYGALLSIRPTQLGSLVKKLLRVRRFVARSSNGCSYWIDPVSVFGYTLLKEGCFESVLTRLVQTLLRPGDTFLDIGGNEGYFSVLAAKCVRAGHVLCIEPQLRLCPVIARNIELNHADCVTVCNTALSDRKGEGELYLRPSSNTEASSFIKHWKLGGKRQRVSLCTLDDLLLKAGVTHARLAKIDCEGAERLVLQGAADTIRRQVVDFWVVDYHEQICGIEDCERAHTWLTDAGYQLARHEGLNIYFSPDKRSGLDSLGQLRLVASWRA